jgi:hypothetical protein
MLVRCWLNMLRLREKDGKLRDAIATSEATEPEEEIIPPSVEELRKEVWSLLDTIFLHYYHQSPNRYRQGRLRLWHHMWSSPTRTNPGQPGKQLLNRFAKARQRLIEGLLESTDRLTRESRLGERQSQLARELLSKWF